MPKGEYVITTYEFDPCARLNCKLINTEVRTCPSVTTALREAINFIEDRYPEKEIDVSAWEDFISLEVWDNEKQYGVVCIYINI